MAWLVAGLGNPGDRYARTRHNLGKMVVEELARGEGVRLKKVRFLPAEFAELREGTERVLLVTSTRYMNESGPTYAGLAKKHDVPPERIVAVHDELEIPPGELHVKLGGGSGGHNGLKSLTQALGTPEYHRVRVGIGRPPGRQDPADYVLEPIGKRLEPDIAIWVERAAEAVRSLIGDGLPPTQDRFNRGAGRG
ncbi:MAG: aminoacyl-tRNA hydrolase [Actinobacteria bacterium]|nr:MAG: aminoacyl-tRNA hydrolase [Actinomycetota bacterium]TMK93496.1 MAG: aminoacyl-tRNA hydrolase [Actinomycetota bacterium]TMM22105.1 MAG: aminoacyl-tRNA hydrolase [Actinomycetota bacterium]